MRKVKLPSSFDLWAFIGKATNHKIWINTESGTPRQLVTYGWLAGYHFCEGGVSRCAELRLRLLLGSENMSNGYSDLLSKSFPINFHAFHNLCSK